MSIISNGRLFDFLDKYKNSFSDLEKLSNFDDENIRKIVRDFIHDIYDFAYAHNIYDYPSVMLYDKQFFYVEGKKSKDYFLFLVYVVRHEHGAYDPVASVMEMICMYKRFSTISVSDVINKLLDVNHNKKFYVIDNALYCSYCNDYYKCDGINWINSDYEQIKNLSCSGKTEEEVINKYGIDVVIKTLELF